MKFLPEDKEEDAAVIFDKGTIKINQHFDLEITRHKRIKIFTEEGKKQANVKIIIWKNDDISGIEAVSVSPDGKTYDLDDDNIFEEEGIRTKTISFPVPGVEAGSVFDVKYKIYSEYISNLQPWSFQDEVFTKYSEVIVYLPSGFIYNKLSINPAFYDLKENYESIMDRDNTDKKIGKFTWSCTDLPGIKDEPFTDNINDNYTMLYFIMVGYKDQYQTLKFSESWEAVSKYIYKYYDNLINNDDAEDTVRQIAGNETDALKKAKLLYDFMRTKVKTTEHKVLAGDDFKVPAKVLSELSGSASEKTLLLINMLKQAGLDAQPVWISTRKNGLIIKDFCDRTQFNRLICQLKIGTQKYFLYPASPAIQFGWLPFQLDVADGLLISEENGDLISIKPLNNKGRINIKTDAKIDSQNSLKVSTQIFYEGLSAADERDAIIDKGAENYVNELFKEKFAAAKLDSFYYTNTDSISLPLILNLVYTIPDFVEVTDSLAYFTLPFMSGIKENPFIKSTRRNPIDLKYSELSNETVKLGFPDGFSVVEVPAKRKRLITNANFSQIYLSGKSFIECTRTIDFNTRRFPARNYADIKALFDEMVSSGNEQVVLVKRNPGTDK